MPKLKDLAIIRTGLAPPPGPLERASSSYVQMKDLDRGRRSLTRAGAPTAGRATPIAQGDVLVAARGERNLVVRPDAELLGAYPTLDVYLVRPDPSRLDPDYLAAFLDAEETGRSLRASKAGASLPRIPKEALAELSVPAPPIARQRAIGALAVCARRHAELSTRLQAAEARLADTRLFHLFRKDRGS